MWRFLYQRVGVVFQTNRRSLNLAVSILSIMIFCFSTVFAQSNLSLTGQVVDKNDGTLIQNAHIEIDGLGVAVSSDNNGIFSIEHVPPGLYSFNISADGYFDTSLVRIDIESDITRFLRIELTPKIYQLNKIVVEGKKQNITSDRVTIISRNEIIQSKSKELSEVLESIEGISIQKTGPSGESQVKIRGSKPGHVLILIDGQKINGSGSGLADLGGIPIEMVEQIELYKGGASAEFGPDALAGAINIITRPDGLFEDISFEVKNGWANWGTKSTDLNISNPIAVKNFSSRWHYTTKKSDGDFYFSYSPGSIGGTDTTHIGTRINNHSKSDNFFVSGIYKPSTKLFLNYSGRYYDASRGIPDRATRQNETAGFTDQRRLITTALNYKSSEKHQLEFELGYSQFKQHFLDIDTAKTLRYDSKFVNDIYSIKHYQSYRLLHGNISRYSLTYGHESLDHTDSLRPQLSMGYSSRNNFSIQTSVNQKVNLSALKLIDILSADATIRYDYSYTDKDSTSYQDTVKSNSTAKFSPKFGVAISKGEKVLFILRASYGKSFRLPTLNALFWKGDALSSGNPGLKPEKSEHSEAGFEFKWMSNSISLSSGMTYFHSSIKDLVVWLPNSQGVWRPINRAKAQITGHEDFVHISLLKNKIRLSYQNTVTAALNKTPGDNSYGKRLTFSPGYITTLSARLNFSPFYLSYSIRMVDKAYTLEANPRPYPSYRLDDINFGMDYNLSDHWQLKLTAKIENLNNFDYVLMTFYPMPGRQSSLFVGLNYNLRKENQ